MTDELLAKLNKVKEAAMRTWALPGFRPGIGRFRMTYRGDVCLCLLSAAVRDCVNGETKKQIDRSNDSAAINARHFAKEHFGLNRHETDDLIIGFDGSTISGQCASFGDDVRREVRDRAIAIYNQDAIL